MPGVSGLWFRVRNSMEEEHNGEENDNRDSQEDDEDIADTDNSEDEDYEEDGRAISCNSFAKLKSIQNFQFAADVAHQLFDNLRLWEYDATEQYFKTHVKWEMQSRVC